MIRLLRTSQDVLSYSISKKGKNATFRHWVYYTRSKISNIYSEDTRTFQVRMTSERSDLLTDTITCHVKGSFALDKIWHKFKLMKTWNCSLKSHWFWFTVHLYFDIEKMFRWNLYVLQTHVRQQSVWTQNNSNDVVNVARHLRAAG